jgi:hypothetical protein
MKLPIKMRMLEVVRESGPVGCRDIMRLLAQEYGAERQFKASAVNNHLLSLRAVGLTEEAPETDEAEARYSITRQGEEKLRKYGRG